MRLLYASWYYLEFNTFVVSIPSKLMFIDIKSPTITEAVNIKIVNSLFFKESPLYRSLLLSNNILLIAAKLLNILLPNTITAAKYSGIPSLSPR